MEKEGGVVGPGPQAAAPPRPLARRLLPAALLLFGCLSLWLTAQAVAQPLPLPRLEIGLDQAEKPEDLALTLQLMIIITILSLAPALLMMLTSFLRIVIVLSFVRQAIGTQNLPPAQVIVGLSLFLTLFVMMPTFSQIYDEAVKPYFDEKLTFQEAYQKGVIPLRGFMFSQTREHDIALFVHLSKSPRPRTRDDVPTWVLIPAFMISELKTAFQIGFVLFIPFFVIDMVVASTLMSMGMFMLPPILISLPFKILLFVLVDGWHLITRSLVLSFS